MNKRLIISIITAIFLIIIIVMKLLSNKEKAEAKIYIHDVTEKTLVEAQLPSNHTFNSSLSFLGTFEPFRQNTINSDAQGKVVKILIEEGDKVSHGQFIAKVDDELLQLQMENADVNLEGKKNDDARNSYLAKDKAISEVQLEKTKLDLKSAEIQKQLLQKQIKMTNIIAPFSGIITKKYVDLGSVIGPGTPLVEITDISFLKLTVNIPERDILKFKVNQSVKVLADIYGNKKFDGEISSISVQADKSHNFKVQILVKNNKQELMAGMYGSVGLQNSQSKTCMALPRKALIGSSKNPQVYVVRNGKAKLISFNSGTSDADYIEIVSGISKNDKIITKGQVNIQNNSNVKVKN
jgi:RND family efflux transporter MFP subunit